MQTPVDFVIITPLEEERDAVLRKLKAYDKLPPTEEDIRVYFSSELPVTFSDGSSAAYSVVVVPLLNMGRVEAANATGDAIRRWRPRFVLLVGIAGGLSKAGVQLGDVLIADQVTDYELQKLAEEEPLIRWQVHRTDQRLLGAVKNLIGNSWLDMIEVDRPATGHPTRHIAPICTGDKVIANGLLDEYREIWTKLIGVEMEAGGIASAAFQAAQAPGFFMIRGVSDLADAEKDTPDVKTWRAYACDVAASYAVAFLQSGPVPPLLGLRQTSPVPSAPTLERLDHSQGTGQVTGVGTEIERQHQEDLRSIKQHQLHILEKQAAMYGQLDCPPRILMQIKELRREIAELDR